MILNEFYPLFVALRQFGFIRLSGANAKKSIVNEDATQSRHGKKLPNQQESKQP